MTDEVPVHVNREGMRELDAPDSVEVTDSFDVAFINHGEALHVHLNTSERLSQVVTVDAGNRHVPGHGERRVRVTVDTDALSGESVFGTLEVSTSYGAETSRVDVEVQDPATAQNTVEVAETLAEPPDDARSPLDRSELAVLAFGTIALALAGLTALVVDDTLVVAGLGVVLVGVLAAVVLVVR